MRNIQQENAERIRLFVLCPEPELKKDLEQHFRSDERFPIQLVDAIDAMGESRVLIQRVAPHVVLLVDMGPGESLTTSLLQLSRELNLDQSQTTTVLLTSAAKADMSYLRNAMNAGTRDVIVAERLGQGKSAPIFREVETAIILAYRFVQGRLLTGNAQRDQKGAKVVTLFSGRGGVGKSVLATALAGEIAHQQPAKRVVAVDMDVQFGSLAPMLGLPAPTQHLAQLLTMKPETNPNLQLQHHLPSVTVRDNSLVYLAAAPQSTAELRYLSLDNAVTLLSLLRRSFDYVVVDLPSQVTDATLTTFQASDRLLLVCTPEPLAVRATLQMLDVFDTGAIQLPAATQVRVALNKVGGAHLLEMAKVEQLFPQDLVAGRLPAAPVFINEHVLSGTPIGSWAVSKQMSCAFLTELSTLYNNLNLAVALSKTAPEQTEPRGVFGRWGRNRQQLAPAHE